MLTSLQRQYHATLKRFHEALAYSYYHMASKRPNQLRVVIFAQGRTGSTLLENLICSTGHFRENGELLNTGYREVRFPLQYVMGLSRWHSDSHFIFHVKVYQLTTDRKHPVDPGSFLKSLDDDGFKIIYLKRRNVVRHRLSNLVALARQTYHKFDDRKEAIRLTIDCRRFTDMVNRRIAYGEAELKALTGLDYHQVVYEDDLEKVETHQSTIDGVLDYLSLDRQQVSTEHRKVNTVPLEDLISNYDEFLECIQKEGWQDFLD